jgi:hypothetical protein
LKGEPFIINTRRDDETEERTDEMDGDGDGSVPGEGDGGWKLE